MIIYHRDRALTPEQFRDLLVRSTLGERRPIDRPEILAGMVANGDLCVTAWDGERRITLQSAGSTSLVSSMKRFPMPWRW